MFLFNTYFKCMYNKYFNSLLQFKKYRTFNSNIYSILIDTLTTVSNPSSKVFLFTVSI